MIGRLKRYLARQERHYRAGNENPDNDAHMAYTAHVLGVIDDLQMKIKEWEEDETSMPVLTKDAPTVPGLYWYRLQGGHSIHFCRVIDHPRKGIVAPCAGGDGFKPTGEFLRVWAGPLLEPIEPA